MQVLGVSREGREEPPSWRSYDEDMDMAGLRELHSRGGGGICIIVFLVCGTNPDGFFHTGRKLPKIRRRNTNLHACMIVYINIPRRIAPQPPVHLPNKRGGK